MNSTGRNVIQLEDLRIGYQQVLLPELQAGGSRGELVALIGPNGVGKSTLIRTICGLQQPLGGQVSLSGTPVEDYSRRQLAATISYVSSHQVSLRTMKVLELVALGRYPFTNWLGRLHERDRTAVQQAMQQVRVWKFRNRPVEHLSDGERQRAMIARALAQETPVMVLDEPTAWLDLANRYEIVDLLRQLAHQQKRTILFSTHDLHIALQKADKIWLLLGSGLEEGAPEDLVLSGSFTRIFKDRKPGFSVHSGSFESRENYSRGITVSGNGEEFYWTRHALRRIGVEAIEERNGAQLELMGDPPEQRAWKWNDSGDGKVFHSLYALCRYLKPEQD